MQGAIQPGLVLKMNSDNSNLKRKINLMPEFIRLALESNNLSQAYAERPDYQKNDYIGWIERTKRQETKDKRLDQMLSELRTGGVYMKMKHQQSAKR